MWVIILVLLLLTVIVLPHWGYSTNWGYTPSGFLGLALVVLVILLLMGRL